MGFKNQLQSLIDLLQKSSPHYVRCIKTNVQKAAFVFDAAYDKLQLKYSGLMETVQVRKKGFPVRMSFTQFLEQFWYLKKPQANDDKDKIQFIFTHYQLNPTEWTLGQTKVFMTEAIRGKLFMLQETKLFQAAVMIQKMYKTHQKIPKKTKSHSIATEVICGSFVCG
jgi:myosin-7